MIVNGFIFYKGHYGTENNNAFTMSKAHAAKSLITCPEITKINQFMSKIMSEKPKCTQQQTITTQLHVQSPDFGQVHTKYGDVKHVSGRQNRPLTGDS